MTGNCTRECTEFGHSDACWMPGQPSPTHAMSTKGAPTLSTFVPYQERDGPMTNGSPKPVPEERVSGNGGGGSGGGGGGGGGSTKVAGVRFKPPYTSAYTAGGEPGKDCSLEEIPLSQAADYSSSTTPSSQGSKREIYL